MTADRDALLRMADELEQIERIEVIKQGGPERTVMVPSWFADSLQQGAVEYSGKDRKESLTK